jgi:two-component system, LytTR family, response regulator
MPLNTVIVDDEPAALDLLRSYAGSLPALTVSAEFRSGLQALDYLATHPVDLLFLDIQMPGLNGLQLLQSLATRPDVVLVTAYPEHAVRGFELSVTDYLLKPVMFPRFVQAVNKVLARRRGVEPQGVADTTAPAAAGQDVDYVFLRVDGQWRRVQLDDILYVASEGDYARVHCRSGALLTLNTLTQMEERLPTARFVRVHRSTIVNLRHVDVVEKDHLSIGRTDISIGLSYRAALLGLLRQ